MTDELLQTEILHLHLISCLKTNQNPQHYAQVHF